MARQTRITDGTKVVRLAPILELGRCLADRDDGAGSEATVRTALVAVLAVTSMPLEAVASFQVTMGRLAKLAQSSDITAGTCKAARRACKHLVALIRDAKARASASTLRKLAGSRLGAGFDVKLYGEARGGAAPEAAARRKRPRPAPPAAPERAARCRMDSFVRSVDMRSARRAAGAILAGEMLGGDSLRAALSSFGSLPADAMCVRDSGVLDAVELLADGGVEPGACAALLASWGHLRGGD